jgi:hypothetical protein
MFGGGSRGSGRKASKDGRSSNPERKASTPPEGAALSASFATGGSAPAEAPAPGGRSHSYEPAAKPTRPWNRKSFAQNLQKGSTKGGAKDAAATANSIAKQMAQPQGMQRTQL